MNGVMIERREDDALRLILRKCELGSREVYRELARTFPCGVIVWDCGEIASHFGVSESKIYEVIKDLEKHDLIKHPKRGLYILPFVIRKNVQSYLESRAHV